MLGKFGRILLVVGLGVSILGSSSLSRVNVRAQSGGRGLMYTVNNNTIYRDGKPIQIYGLNWSGAESYNQKVDGLWTRGYKDIISQMKGLGFNGFRIPICPATLRNVKVGYFDQNKNPDLVGLKSLDVLDKVLNEINSQEMYFIFSHHSINCESISPLWYNDSYSEEDWIKDLEFLARRYANLKNFVAIDLKNENHGATWGKGDAKTDWNLAAERAGKRVLAANPNLLIFVGGITTSGYCEQTVDHFWGENFEPLNCKDIDSSYIPNNKLVLSPHTYGSDLWPHAYFSASNYPDNLPKVWDTHFGFMVDKNKTMVMGEFATRYGTQGGNQKDIAWLDKFVEYLVQKKSCSSFYWALNANSNNVGGLLKDDWESVWTEKMVPLRRYQNTCKRIL